MTSSCSLRGHSEQQKKEKNMKALRDRCGCSDPGNVKRLLICHRLIQFLPGSIGALLVKVNPTRVAVFLFHSLLFWATITKLADDQEKTQTVAVIPVQLANQCFAEIERGANQQAARFDVK